MFESELHIHPVRGDHWELDVPLIYRSERFNRVIIAPKGFQMDLASIPRLLRPLFPVHGRHTRAAVIHDWLYAANGRIFSGTFSRADSDYVFLEAMTVLGVGWFKRRTMYLGVRVGGWVAWRSHQKS